MRSLQTQEAQDKNWEWLVRNVTNKADKVNVALNVKNSQFAQPLSVYELADGEQVAILSVDRTNNCLDKLRSRNKGRSIIGKRL